MKQINLRLEDNLAIIENKEPIFLEKDDTIEFVITNIDNDTQAYYMGKTKLIKIEGNTFTLGYEDLVDCMLLRLVITHDKTQTMYTVKDLRVHDVKVVGLTIDEKYPDIIRELHGQIRDLKDAMITLFEEHFEIMKKDVIE